VPHRIPTVAPLPDQALSASLLTHGDITAGEAGNQTPPAKPAQTRRTDGRATWNPVTWQCWRSGAQPPWAPRWEVRIGAARWQVRRATPVGSGTTPPVLDPPAQQL